MTINLLMTLQVSVVLNILLFILLILSERARLYWKTYAEEREVVNRVSEEMRYRDGELSNIRKLIQMQEDILEMRRNFSNYLLDLLFLALKGDDIKQYIDIVADAVESDD